MKFLVTGIGGDIGIGIINVLKNFHNNSLLIGCDINNYPACKNEVDQFVVAPNSSDKEKYVDFVYDICNRLNIHIVIPTSEKEIKVLNEKRYLFESKNIKLLINNDFIINTFMDKFKTINFFRDNGIAYPETYLLKDYKNELKFPYIFKLNQSAGSKGIFIVNDKLDLKYLKAKYSDGIVQEIVGDIDNEYTIGVFSNGLVTYNIAFQRYLGFGSLSRQVKLVNDVKIDQLVEKISSLVDLKGSINVQVRKNKEGTYIPFEINPRLSSTMAFRHYFGFEDLKWWIDMLYGKEIGYIRKFTEGIGVKTLGEVYFDLKERE